jgi:PST family polysaccharide transporter
MGMILLAKQAARIFIFSVLGQRLLLVGIYLVFYTYFGLLGLGIAYICTGIVHLLFMTIILNHFYKIRLGKRIYQLLLLIIVVTIITIFVRKIEIEWVKYSLGVVLLIFAFLFSYLYMKKNMNIDLFAVVKSKLVKK